MTHLTLIIITISAAASYNQTNALAFFQKYIFYSYNYNNKLIYLYDDKALIHTTRTYHRGEVKHYKMDGKSWKILLKKALQGNKNKNKQDQFKEIRIITMGDKFRIEAIRYSNTNCYTDENYYMIIKPSASQLSHFTIIEEYTETQQYSQCQ